MTREALVLVSGGLDSSTSLYWAKHNFDRVRAISFNYHHRIDREKIASRRITKVANVRLIEVDLPFLKEKSEYTNSKRKTDSRPSQSYIPLRNLIFYSISGYFAQINKIENIVGGHNALDGHIFKDAKSFYLRRLNKLMTQGLLSSVNCKIILPLKNMSPIDIIRLAIRLNVPIQLTWSCHRDGKSHCGQCYACKRRLNAFRFLSLKDPAC